MTLTPAQKRQILVIYRCVGYQRAVAKLVEFHGGEFKLIPENGFTDNGNSLVLADNTVRFKTSVGTLGNLTLDYILEYAGIVKSEMNIS